MDWINVERLVMSKRLAVRKELVITLVFDYSWMKRVAAFVKVSRPRACRFSNLGKYNFLEVDTSPFSHHHIVHNFLHPLFLSRVTFFVRNEMAELLTNFTFRAAAVVCSIVSELYSSAGL